MGELKVVILDRDGVINEVSDEFIKTPEEWIPIEGSLKAIAKLNHAKVKVFVASNQSGIARELFDYNALNEIHQKMLAELAQHGGHLDGIFICPDLEGECRKPKTGMLLEIEKRSHVSLKKAPFIGDSLRDVQAAITHGAQPILVCTGNGSVTAQSEQLPRNIPIYDDLTEAVDTLLAG
jgi:D-glycero-D-manno-heptose 1,7-bisphosphate phosphatase